MEEKMKYRKLGKTGIDVSLLGFGCMRFPTIDSGNEHMPVFQRPVKEKETIEMIQYGFEKGINYFDTAYFYHGGKSETILGEAVKPFRDKILIATKLPAMNVSDPSDIPRFIDEQLKRLNTDYVDFYLLHGLNERFWSLLMEYKVLDFLDKILADGRARYVGFSFHDDLKTFKKIVDGYDWSMCQIQYNIFDENRQAGREGLEYAAFKDMGVVIMEPLRGGTLTANIPAAVQKIWDSAKTKRTPAEWGLRWVFNQPEVSLALSGMSAMSQVVENIATAEDAGAHSLSAEELDLIDRVKTTYEEMLKVGCTGCGYCMPCPNGVDIPTNFTYYNDYYLFGNQERSRRFYNNFTPPENRASHCSECGECEEKCPQQISIMDELKNVHAVLGQN
jgi:predicted aldo/keto reductase-like oxidoreductase